MTDNPNNTDFTLSQVAPKIKRLALRPSETAEALGISERKLREITKSNSIPHLRLGRRIVYPVDMLRDWLREQTGSTQD